MVKQLLVLANFTSKVEKVQESYYCMCYLANRAQKQFLVTAVQNVDFVPRAVLAVVGGLQARLRALQVWLSLIYRPPLICRGNWRHCQIGLAAGLDTAATTLIPLLLPSLKQFE